MRTWVYRKVEGRTGVGLLYEFACLTRNHTTGAESVVYIPLRVEPEWAGTVRHCDIPRADFERKFEHVGEGLPHILPPAVDVQTLARAMRKVLPPDLLEQVLAHLDPLTPFVAALRQVP
jgi:hypothetical protein